MRPYSEGYLKSHRCQQPKHAQDYSQGHLQGQSQQCSGLHTEWEGRVACEQDPRTQITSGLEDSQTLDRQREQKCTGGWRCQMMQAATWREHRKEQSPKVCLQNKDIQAVCFIVWQAAMILACLGLMQLFLLVRFLKAGCNKARHIRCTAEWQCAFLFTLVLTKIFGKVYYANIYAQ